MQQQQVTTVEFTQDQQDALRALLDSEVVLIGGGDVLGGLN